MRIAYITPYQGATVVERPFDLVIIFNLKWPQIGCATYAVKRLGLPVILEYEDDAFVSVFGKVEGGFLSRYRLAESRRILNSVSGCMAVSPHLLSQLPPHVPSFLLRGVVGDDVLKTCAEMNAIKKNRVVFAGTHIKSNGIKELITGWEIAGLSDWELHITGFGGMTEELRKLAENHQSIIFHGLVSRQELVRLLCSANICVNPHAVSQTPGNVFAFKIVEYLGAGAHVITTPMGTLEEGIERGITYMPDNNPDTIAATLKRVVLERRWGRTAAKYVHQKYGPTAVSESLNMFVKQVLTRSAKTSR